jgi:phosphopantothenoylcysteine decarboxylase/phosphopantothenate--cysteine ligase
LDAVRVLTNTSSGRTAVLLAGHFDRAGHEVTLLRAASSVEADAPIRQLIFGSYSGLDAKLSELLAAEEFDAVIHAAAVGDYGVDAVMGAGEAVARSGKIPSGEALTVRLRPQAKLIDQLRLRARNPRLMVVGFKLTTGSDAEESNAQVRAIFKRGVADLVVHNDLAWRTGDADRFPADIHQADGPIVRCETRGKLALELERLLLARSAGMPSTEPLTHQTHAAMS